jgi:hypothetical protein
MNGVSMIRSRLCGWWSTIRNPTIQPVRWKGVAWESIVPSQPPTPRRFDQGCIIELVSENIEKITREVLKVGARAITLTSPISWPPPGMSDSTGIFHVHQRYRLLSRFGVIAAKGEFIELANAFDEVPRLYDDPTKDIELFNTGPREFARLLETQPESIRQFYPSALIARYQVDRSMPKENASSGSPRRMR